MFIRQQGEPSKIDVTFELEASGLLKVSAKDRVTCTENSVTIKSEGLSKPEIQKMIREADKFKEEEDEMHKKKNKASLDFVRYVYRMRESVSNNTLYSIDKVKVEDAVKKAFEWLDEKEELREVCEYEEKVKEQVRVWKPDSASA